MNKGFTLIELIIVMAIVGIIAGIGVPQYIGYADGARVRTAQNNLRSIYLQQQEYYQRNSQYYSSGNICSDSALAINTSLFNGANIIQNDKFTYCVLRDTADDFIASAVEMEGGSGRTFTINQLNQTNF